MLEERLQVAPAMRQAKDERVLVFDAVHNHIFAHGARTSDIREAGNEGETIRDGVDEAVGQARYWDQTITGLPARTRNPAPQKFSTN